MMAEYTFYWTGTVKEFDGGRWSGSKATRGTFTASCEDDDEARLGFDEQSDRFMDRDFLSGSHWIDGAQSNDDWELQHFHIYRIEGPDGDVDPEPAPVYDEVF